MIRATPEDRPQKFDQIVQSWDLAGSRAIGDALLIYLFDACTLELANIITSRPQIFSIEEKHAYRAFQERLRQRP
jgi:hypothetical protein